jgi:hypothetical protein
LIKEFIIMSDNGSIECLMLQKRFNEVRSMFHFFYLPAFAECPIWKDGDECEKGIWPKPRVNGTKADMLRRVSPKL